MVAVAVAVWSGAALASQSPPAGREGPESLPQTYKVTIRAVPFIQFDTTMLKVDGGGPVTVHFVNEDIYYAHNFAVYTDSSATTPLAPGSIGTVCVSLTPCGSDVIFTPPAPGSYYFRCDVHPTMNGSFVVNAPPPTATPTATVPAGPTATPTATVPMVVGGSGALPEVPPSDADGPGFGVVAAIVAGVAFAITLSGVALRQRGARR